MCNPLSTWRSLLLCQLLVFALAPPTSAEEAAAVPQDVERLTAAAEAARGQLDEQQGVLDELQSQLAAVRREAFHAEQSAGLAGRDIDLANEAVSQKEVALAKAAKELQAADSLLSESRRVAIQSARDLKASEQSLRDARQDAARARGISGQFASLRETISESVVVLQHAAELTGQSVDEQVADLRVTLQALEALLNQAESAAQKAAASQADAESKFETAIQVTREARAARREHERDYAGAQRSHFASQREIVALQSTQERRKEQQQASVAERESLEQRIAELQAGIRRQETRVEEQRDAWVSSQERAELAMERAGQFVSFSREVAPIFARRCASCHNNRSAGGRLNMNSYAALLKGGESGESLVAHDADSSLLVMMIEDGSMPQDADPLTVDEVAVIRKWIDVGAPLDARATKTAALFDIMPELPQPMPPESYRAAIPVLATAFHPDGTILATSGYHEVLLWDVNGTLLRRIQNVAQRVHDLEFTADGNLIAVAAGTPGQYGEVKLFRVADGIHVATLVRTTDSEYSVAISPDGKRLAAAGADRVVRIVSLESLTLQRTIEEHSDAVMDISWAADSRRIVTAGQDKVCKVFDAFTGESLQTFAGHEEPVFTAAFLPDGKRAISGGADSKLRIWNLEAEKSEALVETFQKTKQTVIDVFDGTIYRMIVTGEGHVFTVGPDRTIREHQVSDGALVRSFSGHSDGIYGLALSPVSHQLASGSYDGEVRVWNTADGTVATAFVAVPKTETGVDVSER